MHADEPPVTPDDCLAVDMGVVNIATDSDGDVNSGTSFAPACDMGSCVSGCKEPPLLTPVE